MPVTLSALRSGCALVATVLALAASSVCAAADDAPDAQAAYKKQVARCNSGQSSEDKATCLREAGAALAAARKGGLGDAADASAYRQNELKRCHGLPEADQKDCIARIDQGTKSGSVAGGGVIRELRTTQIVTPPGVAPAASQ